ncbi:MULTISPECIES: MFS transporter [unclassified Amycolatopsis]|uniref:MFS transporter n=1 Tax=unclassified Amycolatopsis TaxID=2618356 RepID=UPI0028770D07|nr:MULTISPECIES: MFS transporter [unclassified Amycolatopsis]MDS0132811.1 MFS transporter [Amycolatopsis sp. 505]MDS0142364.1 MFS transporter [Amycolatopsis sp. CM201R]
MLRIFLAATLIDALGSGLWVPFALLFLVHGQGMGLVDAGASLTIGALLALVTGPATGAAMDRFGPRALLIAGNLVRLAAFAAYPLAHTSWQVVVVSAVAGFGDRLFWTCNAPMVARLTSGTDTDRVLATQTVGRFAGAGLGAAAMAVLPTITSPWAFHLLAYANAASFGVAAVLIRLLPRVVSGNAGANPPYRSRPAGSWRAVLGNRAFTGFCVTHMAFTLASASKFSVLPIVVRDLLHGPQWIAGTAITVGTVVVVTGQRPIVGLLAGRSRTAGLIGSAVLFAICFALLVPLTAVPLPVATVLILLTSLGFSIAEALFGPTATAAAAAAAPPGAEGRASSIFQLSWGLPIALAPGLLAALLSTSNALTWSILALTCASAVPALLVLRKKLPEALREPSPPVAA